jgi:midasin
LHPLYGRTLIFYPGETELVEGATDHIFSTIALLDKLAAQEPKAQHLFAPVSSWLRTIIPDESVPELSFGEEERAPDFSKDTISALLTVAQSLLERTSWTASAGDELDDGFVRVKEANLRDFFSRLASDRVSDKLVAFFDQIISSSTSSRYSLASSQHAMLRVHPFLQAYVSILRDFIIETAQWGWATMKFTYVVCSTVRTIAEKGFCRPPDADDAGESDKRGKESDGTGLGEGSGTNNVSEEIEDESQVEGLRGEADDPTDNTPTKQESTAIEMSEDIGGEMEDVNPEEDVDEEKESDDEPEPEDRIGDVDPMAPDAVDEKLWGDEHGPEDDPSDQHTTQDHSTQKPPESDTVAKKGDSTPKKPEEKPGDTEGKGVDDEMADDDDGKQDLPDLDEDRPDLGAQMDDYVPEADTLDLPEELSLDQDEERGQEKSDDDLGEEDFGDVDLDESAADGADGEHRPQDAEEDAIDPLTDEAKETQEDVMGSDGSHEADDDRETEQVTARPDIGGGNDGDVGATPEDTKRASDPPAVPKDNGKSGRGLQHSSEDQLLNSEQNDSEG